MTFTDRDKKHLWHPLTQHKLQKDLPVIVKAKEAVLLDDQGNEYIDGIASWYTAMYGHCNPEIVDAVSKQLGTLDQIVFSGFTHPPAIELSESLMAILPKNQQKLFFSDNGSTSVDVAIKMALQYYYNQGVKRTRIIALEDGFHGDTFGAMSVSDLSVYNGPFEEFFIDVARIPVPSETNINEVEQQFDSLLAQGNVAAFIYEPLVQGAAGMKMYRADLLDRILGIAKKHGVLTIADEVMTGFGKTGTFFASDQIPHKPDIMCLAKSLTAGIASMAITTCTQEVYMAFYDDEITKGFFHGHTYSANPTACAAAQKSIALLQSESFQEHIQRIYKQHLQFAEKMKLHKKVKNVRCLGVIFGMELTNTLDRYGEKRNQLFQFFMKRGVFLRPLGNTIYILPPFVISDEQLDKIYHCIEEVLEIV
ncbi:adenosylmethionine--8-amino-7-oxononanoate transaminase [Flavobacteriaceae bacterium F08102]|nr:adenosylmethionine--8-amino-7-oxononanoate transaminase [Flavobacteriaceae bacterium F08102]